MSDVSRVQGRALWSAEVDGPLCDRVCRVGFDAAVAGLEATGVVRPFGVVLDRSGEVRLFVPDTEPGAPVIEATRALLLATEDLVVGAIVDMVEVTTESGRADAMRAQLVRPGRPDRVGYGILEGGVDGFEVGKAWIDTADSAAEA